MALARCRVAPTVAHVSTFDYLQAQIRALQDAPAAQRQDYLSKRFDPAVTAPDRLVIEVPATVIADHG